MKYKGKIQLDLHVLGQSYEGVQAFVVPETEYRKDVPLLIGTAVIRALQISLEEKYGKEYMGHVMRESLIWHAAMIQYNQTVVGGVSGYIGIARYNGRRPKVIPPYGCEVDIPVRVPTMQIDQPFVGLLERSNAQNGPQNLLIANTVVRVAEQQVTVRVCNPTDQPLTIKRHARLADLYVIDDVTEGPPADTKVDDEKPGIEHTTSNNSHVNTVDLNRDLLTEQGQIDKVNELLNKNADIFSMSSEDYGHTQTLKHSIPLIDETPFKVPRRRVRPAEYNELVDTLKEMEKNGIIKPSKSCYASPIVIARKKDGTMRICIDYRTLNSKTVGDAFPMPSVMEALDALGGAKYFSTLDLTSGYYQIEVEEKDQHKTAFSTPFGLYEYQRMPMGLKNSPATFQRLMFIVFGDMNIEKLLIYLDDLIVFSKTFDEHLERLQQVFDRLRKHGLKLKPSK